MWKLKTSIIVTIINSTHENNGRFKDQLLV